MATYTTHETHQARNVSAVEMDEGDVLIIDLATPRLAPVPWYDGGVSWTINSSGTHSVKVEHSLMPTGFDDDKYWTEDGDSPFSASAEGSEHFRVQRIRFTATKGSPTIVVASATKYEVIV